MQAAITALNAIPLAGLMLVIALGYSLGRVAVAGIALGPAAATMVISLVLGHVGLTANGAPGSDPQPAEVASLGGLGFALFIYSVGFDAAPRLSSSVRDRRVWRFLAVGVLVNLLAVVLILAAAILLGLDGSTGAGILAGALTSTPTYAAAAAVAGDPTRLALAFEITYPIGLAGLVVLIQILPARLGEDLAAEAAQLAERRALTRRLPRAARELTRVFEVRETAIVGVPLRDLDLPRTTGCVVSRVHRADGDAVVIPDGDTTIAAGDHVVVEGHLDDLRRFETLVGPEASDDGVQARLPARRIEVREAAAAGRTLAELRLVQRHHCVLTHISRGDVAIEPRGDVVLMRGDVVEVVGRREDVRRLARELGRFEPSLRETDVAVYAGGIVLGLLIGAPRLPLLGVGLGLGTAGGLLLVGLLLGWRDRFGPFQTHVPQEARQLVRDLGVMLFVGEAGLLAGHGLSDAVAFATWRTLGAAALVTVGAVLGAHLLARHLLRLRPLDAWGSVCGGLTSSAALHTVRRVSDSNEAAGAYAIAYAIGVVVATAAGPLVVALLA